MKKKTKSEIELEQSLEQKRRELERSRQIKQKLEEVEPQIRDYVLSKEIILESFDCSEAEARRLSYSHLCISAYNKFGLPFMDVSRNAYWNKLVDRMKNSNIRYNVKKI